MRRSDARLGLSAVLLLLASGCRHARPVETEEATPAALFAAARAGDLAVVERLVDAGVPVDAGDRYEVTALLMAAGRGHADVVRLLLDRGADPDRRESFFGQSAFDLAAGAERFDVAGLLLAHGADQREDALRLAVERDDLDLARAAVDAGPIHASTLVELRAGGGAESAEMRALLEHATSRPDPAPPRYGAEELARFGGLYESFEGGRHSEALVTPREGALEIAVDGGEPATVRASSEREFRSTDGGVLASFYGRAGTIERLTLRRDGGDEVRYPRSLAEPVGPSAFRGAPASDAAIAEPTVHWPGFRGRAASGIGDGAETPSAWDLALGQNVLWQASLPGLGNSSPIVWGERVFVTTAVAAGIEQGIRTGLTGAGDPVTEAVEHSWRVLAFDKRSGAQLWDTEVGRAVPLTRRHFKATQANATPVTDGRRLCVTFPTAGLACLDLDGRVVWRHALGGLNASAPGDPGLEWGFASSPILHEDRVILQIDVEDGPYVAAWDLATGEPRWRVARDVAPSWATPSVLPGPERDELVLNGTTIHGYDARTGEELWSLAPNSELAIATPVVGDGVVYVSAGYPPVKPIYAIRAGARGALASGDAHLAFSHDRGGAYMPTPILYRGILLVVHHNGIAVAYDAASGASLYKSRFSRGGTFTASPVAVNGRIYAATEEGQVYVLDAGPQYREVAVNEIGEPVMATPAVSEGILLVRTPTRLIALAGR